MKKKYLLILILLLTVGFASINTVLDLKGNVSIGFKEDDFNVKISKVVIDEGNTPVVLSEDKQSFTFTGTGSNKIEYTITNRSYQYDANINIMCEPSANIVINQVGEVVAQSKKSETIESNNTGVITCRMDINKISKTEIAEDMCTYEEGKTWEFDYTGSEQEFVVPCDGEYKIELWGAQGIGNYGGLGAYVSGNINFNRDTNTYLVIGSRGESADMRLDNNILSRIIVASSGGATFHYNECNHGYDTVSGGAAGGLVGYPGKSGKSGTAMIREAQGGTQTAGGLFGYGNEYQDIGNSGSFGYGGPFSSAISGSGGAGYYGGGSSGRAWCNGGSGAGGSSFISGHNGCDAISKDSTESNIIHTGQPNHYSGYVFTDTKMIDGNGYNWTNVKGSYTGMPSHDGLSTMTGNSGNGYAKITYLG